MSKIIKYTLLFFIIFLLGCSWELPERKQVYVCSISNYGAVNVVPDNTKPDVVKVNITGEKKDIDKITKWEILDKNKSSISLSNSTEISKDGTVSFSIKADGYYFAQVTLKNTCGETKIIISSAFSISCGGMTEIGTTQAANSNVVTLSLKSGSLTNPVWTVKNSAGTNIAVSNNTFTITATDTYTISVTGTDKCGNSITIENKIPLTQTDCAIPTAIVTDQAAGSNTITLSIIGGSLTNMVWTVKNSAGTNITVSNNTFTITATDSYSISVTGTDRCGKLNTLNLQKQLVYTAPITYTIYIGSHDKNLYALDGATGNQKWVFSTTGQIWSSPIAANGLVFVGSLDKKLYAIDAVSGKIKWSFLTGGEIYSSPLVENGVIFIGSADGSLYAIDAITGQQKWRFGTSSITSELSFGNGIIYASGLYGEFHAIDITTGKQKWNIPRNPNNNVFTGSTLANGIIYVSGTDKFLYALDANTGSLKWKFNAQSPLSTPSFANGIVFVGDDYDPNKSGYFYALDASTGKQKWAFFENKDYYVFGQPVIENGLVYTLRANDLLVLDTNTGAEKWRYSFNGYRPENVPSPVIVNGIVYTGTHNEIQAFDALTGKQKWKSLSFDVNSSPCVVSSKGEVYRGLGNARP